ncbi:Hypothetical protein NTJ_11140 [Nesidiocoris tenuis]|uniref:Uncharacterized protein n=1 Tax=Nesidiocoris tenuis TaxID=355587 RepID=A0ABN7B3Z8_9HEMI|nr:Hypothetical protein NTJ_11140 [Nesidiocoris tenuis]
MYRLPSYELTYFSFSAETRVRPFLQQRTTPWINLRQSAAAATCQHCIALGHCGEMNRESWEVFGDGELGDMAFRAIDPLRTFSFQFSLGRWAIYRAARSSYISTVPRRVIRSVHQFETLIT